MKKFKFWVWTAAVLFFIAGFIIGRPESANAYCVGITLESSENGNQKYSFIFSQLKGEEGGYEIDIIEYNVKSFEEAALSLKESGIKIYYPSAKAIYLSPEVSKAMIEEMYGYLYGVPSFPLKTPVVIAENPAKLASSEDALGKFGAFVIPKITAENKCNVSISEYIKGEAAPAVSFDGQTFSVTLDE